MRVLVIEGSEDPQDLKPIISIPVSEAGLINLETINVLRVGDLDIEGEHMKDHAVVLPVLAVEDGLLKFVDPLFPEAVFDPAGKSGEDAATRHWVGEVRYFLMTIDQSLNWSKRPVLDQMLPDSLLLTSGYRFTGWSHQGSVISNQPGMQVNLVGQVLLTSEPDDSGQNRVLFRLTGLTPGIYLVVAVFEHGKAVEKVIIGR